MTIGAADSGAGKLLAGGTIDIASVTDEVKTSVMNDPARRQYDRQVHANQTVVGTGVTSSGSLLVGADLTGSGALNVGGSALTVAEALTLSAADNVRIVSAQENHLSDTASTRSSNSVFKGKTTTRAGRATVLVQGGKIVK